MIKEKVLKRKILIDKLEMSTKFEIGDKVRCIANTCEGYNDDERLVVGETYTIKDIDFHFPNKICVKLKGPYYFHREFVPEQLFDKVSLIRESKINEILKTNFFSIFKQKIQTSVQSYEHSKQDTWDYGGKQ